ncbi:MAG: PfkB family carbohydrate kinase [Thermomicrobiales bacterium]
MSEHNGRVVTFGEAMVRLTPAGNERLERSIRLDLSPGGAELNTAVTLACLAVPTSWVSILPDNALGRYIDRQARGSRVDMSSVQWAPESEGRMGLYFLEEGVDPRPSAVTYDRAGSAIARVAPGTFDWPALLDGALGLHISGITPAVSDGCRAETLAAMRAANAARVPVFFDLNYRSKLWSEEEARACFVELVPMVDVLFASRGGLRTFYGLDGDHGEIMEAARTRLGVAVVAMTRKKAKGSQGIKLLGMALGPSGELVQSEWRQVEIVDRLGGGDAFAGGFIAGYLADTTNLQRAVSLGIAASALKHTMPGDFLCATKAEIEAATAADEAGVLQR